MALLFSGLTKCSICKKVIGESDQVYLFPSFVANSKDILFFFNDASFHLSCLKNHALCEKAIQFSNIAILKGGPTNRICEAGGNIIKNYADHIFIPLLTSNENEELFNYNFVTLDKNNLMLWKNREKFICEAKKFVADGKWGDFSKYKFLDDMIKILQV